MIDQVKQRSTHPMDFLTSYRELCTRYGTCPMKLSRAYVLDGILDVNVDRIQNEEWKPLLEALQVNQSLRCIALRSLTKSFFGAGRPGNKKLNLPKNTINPNFVSNLCGSLAQLIKTSAVLESLTLQNLPLKMDHLHVLKESLTASKSLMYLSLERCPIGDTGVRELCIALKNVANLEAVNFSECNLTWHAVNDICDVVQCRGLKIHSDAWQMGLRQQSTQPTHGKGLRLLALNGNPGIGDRGTVRLTEVLLEDLWLKELGLQHCGITDEGAHALLKLLMHNQTLSVVDIQGNPLQDEALFQKLSQTRGKTIHQQLDNKQIQTTAHTVEHSHWTAGAQISSFRSNGATDRRIKGPKSKIPNEDANSFLATKNALKVEPSSSLEVEVQLNMYKRLLEEEKTAHKETSKKLDKLTKEYEALQAILKSYKSGSYVDSTLLAQIEATFVKLQEFLHVLKATGFDQLGSTPFTPSVGQLFQTDDISVNNPSSAAAVHKIQDKKSAKTKQNTNPSVSTASSKVEKSQPSVKTASASKTVQWTALQRHQAAGPPISSYSGTPSPDPVSHMTYDKDSWVQDENGSQQAVSSADQSNHSYVKTQTDPNVVKIPSLQHATTGDLSAPRAVNWMSTGQQMESSVVYSNRVSGSGESDSSSNKRIPNPLKPSGRSSSGSLTDIVSEDEF